MPKTHPPESRFWPKVDKDGPVSERCPELGPCWLWTGAGANRYGAFRAGGRSSPQVGAHVFSYELAHGTIPDGRQINHLCERKSCVNPAHLEAVTALENMRYSKPWLAGWRERTRIARAATHCSKGHPWTPENTYMPKDGRRRCLACKHLQGKRRYQHAVALRAR